MTHPDPAIAARLASLLSHYAAAFAILAADAREEPFTMHADTCFAALRLQQRTRWPAGAPLVDEVGACACDVLVAWRDHGPRSLRVGNALRRHELAVHALQTVLETTMALRREEA